MRASYLKLSLTQLHGHEILFVGSGGVFRYSSREGAARDLHLELIAILKRHTQPRASRYGTQPEWLYRAKQAARKLLGGARPDLYDPSHWAVFRD